MKRLACAVLVTAFALAAAPAGAIIHPDGGGRVPWQALVTSKLSPTRAFRCGGTIRDATHVITAAHCTFTRSGRPLAPSAITVVAGITSADAPEATAQSRDVIAISSDAQFALTPAGAYRDDAVLTLAAPLDLSDRGIARALPLAAPGARASAAAFSGWGRTAAHGRGGTLHRATLDVLPPRRCSSFGTRFVARAMLCADRVRGRRVTAACYGDSGGGLVDGGRLIGIASFVGSRACANRRFPTVFARVTAPEINAFLRQPDPPSRPAQRVRPSVSGLARVGSAVRCRPGRWSGDPALSYLFVRLPVVRGRVDRAAAGVELAPFSPSPTYRSFGGALASAVLCVVRAENAGGAVAALSAGGVGPAGAVSARRSAPSGP